MEKNKIKINFTYISKENNIIKKKNGIVHISLDEINKIRKPKYIQAIMNYYKKIDSLMITSMNLINSEKGDDDVEEEIIYQQVNNPIIYSEPVKYSNEWKGDMNEIIIKDLSCKLTDVEMLGKCMTLAGLLNDEKDIHDRIGISREANRNIRFNIKLLEEEIREYVSKMDSTEVKEKCTRLADLLNDEKGLQDKMSGLRESAKKIKFKIDLLTEEIREQSETRKVKCRFKYDYEKATKSLYRVDTNEILNTEPLADSDRQMKIKTYETNDGSGLKNGDVNIDSNNINVDSQE